MDRVRDYSTFAIGFCGVGYLLLWPFCSPDASGELFGTALLCGDRAVMPLRWLCALPHPLHLSLPLNLLGLFSAVLAVARLALKRLTRRWPRAGALAAADAPTGHPPAISIEPNPVCRARRLPPLGPLRSSRPVTPRTHFGLRGRPH